MARQDLSAITAFVEKVNSMYSAKIIQLSTKIKYIYRIFYVSDAFKPFAAVIYIIVIILPPLFETAAVAFDQMMAGRG